MSKKILSYKSSKNQKDQHERDIEDVDSEEILDKIIIY